MKMARSRLSPPVRNCGRPSKGFTLIEVVTALSLLSIGAITLAGEFAEAIRAGNISQRRQLAILLATQKLAELQSTNLAQTGELSGGFGEPFADYSWRAIIEPDFDGRLLNIWLEVRCQAATASVKVSVMKSVLIEQP